MKYSLYILLAVILFSCGYKESSVREDPGKQVLAERYYLKGIRNLNSGNAGSAAESFEQAYDLYSLIYDTGGKVKSALAAARIYRRNGDTVKEKNWKEKAYILIDAGVAESDKKYLYEIESLFSAGNYSGTVAYYNSIGDSVKENDTGIQILLYKLLAEYKTGGNAGELAGKTIELAGKDYIFRETEAFAKYNAGYLYSKAGRPEKAIECFTNSLHLYKEEGNYEGTADNLYLLGLTEAERKKTAEARAYLNSARDIYLITGKTGSLEKTDSLLAKLVKPEN